ncbi:GPW/gp25 family protein, partial [Carbonactinospora thermoautotrophica]|uniref:GPW/gp25 family protein n=1 Tax=Carbonactinospora thermoautotrophica TaxID=1469144 RepID=UPI000A5AA828
MTAAEFRLPQATPRRTDIAFPFRIDRRGRTADAAYEDHVRDMIEQLLFTSPGERVMRPDFGCGLLDLVFAPNSPELASALQLSVQAALQRWLGDVIEVESLEVVSEEKRRPGPPGVRGPPHRGPPRRGLRGQGDQMSTECRAERRRAEVRAARLNGVDGVEVSDDGLTLTVTFLGKAPRDLGPEHIRIEGGRRITDVRAIDVQVERAEDPDLDDRVHVTLDKAGDTSTYRLRVVEPDAYGRPGTEPRRGFDPRYHAADFEFRPACPSEFDCQTAEPHPPKTRPQPVIDYLARDYASLRRLLLDRMTLTAPDWVERHVPDLGVTLVELLAYVGDQISYHQDAVATEAYLDTARRRVSVRRHVRLVDYAMHDGCNARAWIVLEADRRVTLERGGFRFAAIDVGRLDPRERPDLGPVLSEEDLARLPHAATCEVFEPVGGGDLTLYPEHNRIPFWTWGEEEGFLPEGATSATLRDEWAEPAAGPGAAGSGARGRKLRLKPGDVIVIEEVLGRETGSPADADPAHRQAVRLTSVTPAVDELYDQPVLEVTWDPADALAFPVCVRARGGPDCRPLGEVSVARGN